MGKTDLAILCDASTGVKDNPDGRTNATDAGEAVRCFTVRWRRRGEGETSSTGSLTNGRRCEERGPRQPEISRDFYGETRRNVNDDRGERGNRSVDGKTTEESYGRAQPILFWLNVL